MLDSCQFALHFPRIHAFLFMLFATLILAMVLAPSNARAQNRVDLDDLNVKGELLNDNRLRMSSRDQHQISDRVSYRNNFRKEITDGLETQWPEPEAARIPASLGGGK